MSWNNIPNEERLRLWKNLRESISAQALPEQLDAIAKFFADMPYESRTIDYYSPASWPTPWEILFYGSFCKSSISLLMFHTLSLLHNGAQIELSLINDGDDLYLIPVIDYQFVLNYIPGTVNNLQDINADLQIIKTFAMNEIKQIS